jgi:hypothetical protein
MNGHCAGCLALAKERDELKADNARMRSALEEISDSNREPPDCHYGCNCYEVKIAKKALKIFHP